MEKKELELKKSDPREVQIVPSKSGLPVSRDPLQAYLAEIRKNPRFLTPGGRKKPYPKIQGNRR